ncbi:MAG TPA: glycerophosphodiester phosphodiesterase family protein [Microvirga sp.]|jgi:glycerophosphoryl diester phosphodiesterase|nr:glycerophosphodiester phosphodiesterase family protein [Microvirga sp.]
MSAPAWLTAAPIAHRGLHDRANGIVENTLTALDAAADRGFAIECDVQLTVDGDAVVFHDFVLDRLTGETGPVAERTGADLARIAIAGTASDRIPTLPAFLDRLAGRVPLVLEIKSRFNGDMRLTDRTCEVLRSYRGPVCVKSFDPRVVAHLRRIAPGLTRGIVAESRHDDPSYGRLDPDEKRSLGELLHFAETQPHFLSWKVSDLPAGAPLLARLLGRLPVMAWTVRTAQDRERAAQHADQMVFEGFVP